MMDEDCDMVAPQQQQCDSHSTHEMSGGVELNFAESSYISEQKCVASSPEDLDQSKKLSNQTKFAVKLHDHTQYQM